MSFPLPSCLSKSRCIIHIDLDCFYCQVEEQRAGLAPGTPAAVQQWNGLIAVNYAARKAGVQRHSTVEEAKKLCPEIVLLHVATYAENDKEPHYYPNPNRATHKVSLDPYRNTSKQIFKVFSKYCSSLQKIGLDEAFMDITQTVNDRLKARYLDQIPELYEKFDDLVCEVPIDWDKYGITVRSEEESSADMNTEKKGDLDWSLTTWCDLQLAVGAEVAAEIRQTIFDELGLTCSAGIAHYKVVAKLCSSKNKPDKQTILRNCSLSGFMKDIPFTKIRNLGGKLGSEVENDLKIDKASDLWQYNLEFLQSKYGQSTGTWLYNISRGIDNEEVNATKAPKSLMAAKSMRRPVTTSKEMERWLSTLCAELHTRVTTNFEDYGSWPKTLSLHYRTARGAVQSRSKSCPMLYRGEFKDSDRFLKKVVELFGTIEDPFPCIGISVQANGCVQDTASSHDISKFLVQCPQNPVQESILSTKHSQEAQIVCDQPSDHKHGFFAAFHTETQNTPSKTSPKDPEGTMSFNLGTSSDPLWTCDKCHERIPHTQVEEHTDYHFALELHVSDRKPAQVNTSSKSILDPKPKLKRKSKTEITKPEKKQKITMFFQKP
ncbi:hypothetical protein CLU79DRAFT_267836 [Phycomyces nitens]|nr:hypothetical protein CLU79DRAFT_267836 [Phycomyces nitens]